MIEAAFILELIAGLFFVAAAVPLLRLARETGLLPERTLGFTFLLMGLSYLFYETPYALEDEALIVPFSLAGRVLWDASVVTTATFTRIVFHRDQRWAAALVWGVVVLLLAGFAVSVHYGDLEGMAPTQNPGFWLEWVGQLAPFIWVSTDALIAYSTARRRVRIGLVDPLVSNRYLLFAGFGLAQLATVALLVPLYVGYEKSGGGGFTDTMDQLLGSFEMLTIAFIWLAFFPPRLYQRWITRVAEQSAVES